MRKAVVLITMLALIALTAVPLSAYDQTGKIGLSYRFGFHTVMKDPWKLRFAHGGEVKFGLNKWVMVGVTGTYGRTTGADSISGAPPKFMKGDNKNLRLYNYIIELGPTVNLLPDKEYNVYLTAGVGIDRWQVKGGDGKVAKVNDLKGVPFRLEDQRMSFLIGGGFEYFLIEQFSVGAALRYHAFSSIFSQFRKNDDRKIDGSDALDIPKGLFEGTGVVTAYLGRCADDDKDGVCNDDDKCPDTPDKCKVDENGCPIDSDGDGVCDGRDKCPDTPRCAKVDLNGCPIDSDKDGVPDGCDKCPDTPADCKVDASGCPIDSDGDGIPDCRDKCPDTPAGCKVDASGCPIDSDNDGVCDGRDKCPGTPAGLAVDENGCPRDYKIEKDLVLTEVQFIVNTWTLTDKAKKALDEVCKSLAAFPHVRLEVQGHTDISGRRSWNDTLAQNRAQAVVDYFVNSCKLDAGRFDAKGYGPDRPKYDNATTQGRVQNRRVELIRLNE